MIHIYISLLTFWVTLWVGHTQDRICTNCSCQPHVQLRTWSHGTWKSLHPFNVQIQLLHLFKPSLGTHRPTWRVHWRGRPRDTRTWPPPSLGGEISQVLNVSATDKRGHAGAGSTLSTRSTFFPAEVGAAYQSIGGSIVSWNLTFSLVLVSKVCTLAMLPGIP